MKGLAIYDESNIGFAAASMATHLQVGDQPTNAVLGVLRRLRDITMRTPTYSPLFLADGKSWRYDVFDDYKGSRELPPTTKQEVLNASIKTSLQSQKPLIKQALSLLGVPRMYAFNLEADDLAAMVVRLQAGTRKILMISADKDWIQLVRPGVAWFDVINNRRIDFTSFNVKNDSNKSVGIGFERNGKWITLTHPKQWSDVKCLMGDPSDEIEGVGGIGARGAVELVATYGSVSDFANMVMEKSIDVDKLPKKFRDFALAESKYHIYIRNNMLMNLEHKNVPKPIGLKLTKPVLDVVGFKSFCRDWMLDSILTDLPRWIEPFEKSHAIAA